MSAASRKVLWLGLLAAGPLGAGLVGLLHTRPARLEVRSLASEVQILERRIVETRRQRRAWETFVRRDRKDLDRVAGLLARAVGPHTRHADLLPLFARLARGCGVRLLACHPRSEPLPGAPVPEDPALGALGFSLEAQAPPERLLAFIGALETHRRPISLSAAELIRDAGISPAVRAKLQVDVLATRADTRGDRD